MHFIDEVKIFLKSGAGGSGSSSFRREKFVAEGGPDGGNGGKGGDIIFKCISGLNTLIDFRYKQHFNGENGENGKGKCRTGKSRPPLMILVPLGTQIISEDGEHIVHDFTVLEEEYTILKGGKGGLGNINFKSSVNQAPRKFTYGDLSQEMCVWLKLKLLSEVGIIGLPNAGKSTYLSKVSRTQPKIADYAFTTLIPMLGVVYIDEDEFVIADIPGLIEGAHSGHGLGDKFLKHIERCNILLHLIGASEDVVEAYKVIRNELTLYKQEMELKQEIICINKIDLVNEEELQEKLQALQKYTGKDIYLISAINNEGIKEVNRALLTIIKKHRKPKIEEDRKLLG